MYFTWLRGYPQIFYDIHIKYKKCRIERAIMSGSILYDTLLRQNQMGRDRRREKMAKKAKELRKKQKEKLHKLNHS